MEKIVYFYLYGFQNVIRKYFDFAERFQNMTIFPPYNDKNFYKAGIIVEKLLHFLLDLF